MAPPLKSAATRQRRNKKSTANRFDLDANADAEVPELPSVREWYPETLSEWESIWTSPMAGEFIDNDYYGLLKLIVLVDEFWDSETTDQKLRLMVEIRLQRADFGLSTLARSRLSWEIGRGEDAQTRRKKRQDVSAAQDDQSPSDDHRSILGRQGSGSVGILVGDV